MSITIKGCQMIPRIIASRIKKALLEQNKIIILYGPRQVGKTTLMHQILREVSLRKLEINADQLKYREVLSSRDLAKMKELIGNHELLFIDEAQNIPDIGINLKILHDSLPALKIIATGSSAFELANQVREPLTGRTKTFRLYPISVQELLQESTPFEIKHQLDSFLIYGMYPEILEMEGRDQKIEHLHELGSAYLYKDILKLSNIKHSDKIHKLLRMLALQVGSLVSLHEIGKALEMSHNTVNDYVDLLEKGFIVFRLSGFSRNLRKEITKMNKVYFYDLGIRNMLIGNFNPLDSRADIGSLWENFLLIERYKKMAYAPIFANTYFWRTYGGAELDYVEEREGRLLGYEFKYKAKKAKPPKSWMEGYENTGYEIINRENFLDFVT